MPRRPAQDPLLDRPVPHSQEAEHRVIGTALARPESIPTLRQHVSHEDYHAHAHRIIWATTLAVYDELGTVTPLLVTDRLRDSEHLAEVGGLAYVDSMADTATTAQVALHYAAILRRHTAQRRIIEAAYAALSGAYAHEDPQALLSQLSEQTAQVTEGLTKGQSQLVLADVQPQEVRWLWPGRIPLGMLTVLDGDPGLGKSLVTMDLAARISTGRAMPDDTKAEISGQVGVIVMSAEDDLAATIRPRLESANADLTRIVALQGDPPPTIGDLALIRQAITDHKARLVIIDPLMAYLPASTNSYRDQDVRRILAPLATIASDTGAAIVLVRHLTKSGGTHAVYRGGGSIGIIGAARSGLMITEHPEDSDARVLAGTKSNLAPRAASLVYRIHAPHRIAQVSWEGTIEHSASDLLEAATMDLDEKSALADAVKVLYTILSAGPKPAKEVEQEAYDAGVTRSSYKRARAKLGVQAAKSALGGWVIALPEHV